jgi:hypothetical protein
MYSTELADVIQQERERAIREARLHHRADLLPAGPRLQRLRAMVASVTAAFARPRVTSQDPTPSVADRTGRPGTACPQNRTGSGVTRA